MVNKPIKSLFFGPQQRVLEWFQWERIGAHRGVWFPATNDPR